MSHLYAAKKGVAHLTFKGKLSGIRMKNFQNITVLNFVQTGERNFLSLYKLPNGKRLRHAKYIKPYESICATTW